EGDDGDVTPSLGRLAPPRRFDQHLAHCPGSNTFEMRARRTRDPGRRFELEPRFVDERGRAERSTRIVTPHPGREPPQLLVRRAEQIVECPPVVQQSAELPHIRLW